MTTTNTAGQFNAQAQLDAATKPARDIAEVKSSHPSRVPLHADEPATLGDVFERALAPPLARPDAINYKRDGAWHSISSTDFLRRAHAVADGLSASGVGRGERAAILSESSPEWVLADMGCLFAGIVDVPIYPTLAPQQVAYILNDSGASLLFIQHRAAYERIRDAIRGCTQLRRVVFLTGEESGNHDGGVETRDALTLAQLEELGETARQTRPGLAGASNERAIMADDLATIIYTSGTTGEPKGVMLTHSNVVSNLIDTSERLAFRSDDVILSVLPLSHIFERGAMYMYLHHGASVFFAESIERIGDNLREVRPTVMCAVPRLYEKIYEKIQLKAAEGGRIKAVLLDWAVGAGKRQSNYTLNGEEVPPLVELEHRVASRLVFSKWRAGVGGRVRMFVSGGAALPEEICLIFAGAGLPIVQGYGLTETSPVISANSPQENRVGRAGRPIRNVEVRIASDGEIETRGPNVMLGYFNKPDATRDAFTADGWYKTGDIGALDAGNFLRITDRKKELFKTSGGKYIAPQPIEQRIRESRFVSQVVLVGNGRKFPAALIVPDWEQLRSYAQLKSLGLKERADFCRHPRIIDLLQRQVDSVTADMSHYERVKKIAVLERELSIEGGEMTPTLKVKRRVVDEKYKDVIDRLYTE